MRFRIDRSRAPGDVGEGRYVVVQESGCPLEERSRRTGQMVYMAYDLEEDAKRGQERAIFDGYSAEVYDKEDDDA